MNTIDPDRLSSALRIATDRLLTEMEPGGYWKGDLSSSALATAIAVSSLSIANCPQDSSLVDNGVKWLVSTQNADGGWGDTTDSPSNLSTTLLAVAAMKIAKIPHGDSQAKAHNYVLTNAGSTPEQLVYAISRKYGDDKTFAVPILMNCALADMVPWSHVPALPFELAVFPQSWYRMLRMHVVSYALPALIAIGLTVFTKHPPKSPGLRFLRRITTNAVVQKLQHIQPVNGGFLEATPLTGFVAMSLGAICGADHPVVSSCLAFIRSSQRADGSWPIDTDLSVWLTTEAVSALKGSNGLASIDVKQTGSWIINQQIQTTHPFTGAAAGGFPWTHNPGGVPDADDTSGAVLALIAMGQNDGVPKGVEWLLGLQNADGGWPAFCRGWGQLPFDKSSPDITSHVIRALRAYLANKVDPRCTRAIGNGLRFLNNTQNSDGSWVPLWFGNQAADNGANPVFGTARTLQAYDEVGIEAAEPVNGVKYLLCAQNQDGGWGGTPGISSSVEETATAVSALTRYSSIDGVTSAIMSAAEYLMSRIEDRTWDHPAPIGLYFSSLWYSERLYPVIWTVEALGSICNLDTYHVSGMKNHVGST